MSIRSWYVRVFQQQLQQLSGITEQIQLCDFLRPEPEQRGNEPRGNEPRGNEQRGNEPRGNEQRGNERV